VRDLSPAAARPDGDDSVPAFSTTWQIAAVLGQQVAPLPILPTETLVADLEQLPQDLLMAVRSPLNVKVFADVYDAVESGHPTEQTAVFASHRPFG
jgi:hypothetical protein